mgnify:CR=1 FL=1
MRFVKFHVPLLFEFHSVKLLNVYHEKKHYYGVIKCSDPKEIAKMNETIRKNIHSRLSFTTVNDIFHMKFTTHYGRPKYSARTKENMPTVAEALRTTLETEQECLIDLVVKIEGYTQEDGKAYYVFQCTELYVIA